MTEMDYPQRGGLKKPLRKVIVFGMTSDELHKRVPEGHPKIAQRFLTG